uniref:protein-serine/threonine phosphatase n=1 Tax=Solanum tuberosum TaxID=4113 RepID=M1CGP2_SOLTU
MEESKMMFDNCSRGNESSSNSKPPNPLAGDRRLVASATKKSLVRHPSLVRTKLSDVPPEPRTATGDHATEYLPILRSGAWADIGSRSSMEDVYVCTDNLMSHHRTTSSTEGTHAFYGVFDGHGGKHAADFACNHLPRFIAEDEDFPRQIDRAISSAFLQTDTAFAEACHVDADLASGTTALAALVIGRFTCFQL